MTPVSLTATCFVVCVGLAVLVYFSRIVVLHVPTLWFSHLTALIYALPACFEATLVCSHVLCLPGFALFP